MTEAQYCYPGPDDGLKFTVPNPPPEYWRKQSELFRRDGVNANGVVRYVLEKSVGE